MKTDVYVCVVIFLALAMVVYFILKKYEPFDTTISLKESNKNSTKCNSKYYGKSCLKDSLYYFNNHQPANAYGDLLAELGEPTVKHDTPNGIVMWTGIDYFENILLMDESIEHLEPDQHCDYLYASIKVHIPDSLLPIIIKLNKSITYDRLKKELTVRCNNLRSIVAVMWICTSIINDTKLIKKINTDDVIRSSKNWYTYRKYYDELEENVRNNQLQFADELVTRTCLYRETS